LVTPG